MEATNRSDHPVRMTSAGFFAQDGSGGTIVAPLAPHGATIPERSLRTTRAPHFWRTDLEQLVDLRKPLVAFVNLATGEKIRSKSRTLFKD